MIVLGDKRQRPDPTVHAESDRILREWEAQERFNKRILGLGSLLLWALGIVIIGFLLHLGWSLL